MTVAKMPLVNVSPQVSVDVCKGNGSGPMQTARGSRGGGGGGGGQKWQFLQTFFMYEPISSNLSLNLSRKNA